MFPTITVENLMTEEKIDDEASRSTVRYFTEEEHQAAEERDRMFNEGLGTRSVTVAYNPNDDSVEDRDRDTEIRSHERDETSGVVENQLHLHGPSEDLDPNDDDDDVALVTNFNDHGWCGSSEEYEENLYRETEESSINEQGVDDDERAFDMHDTSYKRLDRDI